MTRVSNVLSPPGSAPDKEAKTRLHEKVGLIGVYDPMLGRPLQNTRLSLPLSLSLSGPLSLRFWLG